MQNSQQNSKLPISVLEPGFSFGGPLECLMPKEFHSHILSSSYPLGSDSYWMREAFKESLSGVGVSNPNPAVGCLIVDSSGQEIARGSTQAYGGKHAERVAFEQITDSKKLEGATAYITLEPCSHTGRQPPCVDLLINSPIHRIVIARGDPHPLVDGHGLEKLKKSGKEIHLGLFSNEASAWNFPFFAYHYLKRPMVALKWAQTLDGQLADDSGSSQWISGPSARAYTHHLRQRYDAILIGAGTLLADFPKLTARDCASSRPLVQPLPIVFDPHGVCFELGPQIQSVLKQSLFTPERQVVHIATETVAFKRKNSWMETHPHLHLLTLSTDQPHEMVSELMRKLSEPELTTILGHPLQSLMVEGGPKTLSLFLQQGFADLVHVMVSPLITGGESHRLRTNSLLNQALRYELRSHFRLGSDSVMELVPPFLGQQIFGS